MLTQWEMAGLWLISSNFVGDGNRGCMRFAGILYMACRRDARGVQVSYTWRAAILHALFRRDARSPQVSFAAGSGGIRAFRSLASGQARLRGGSSFCVLFLLNEDYLEEIA